MNRVSEAIYSILTGASAFTSVASNRLYPSTIAQGSAYPCCVSNFSSFPLIAHDGDQGLIRSLFQFDYFGDDSKQVNSLADAVYSTLQPFKGTVALTSPSETVEIQGVRCLVEAQPMFEGDPLLFRSLGQYEIWHRKL